MGIGRIGGIGGTMGIGRIGGMVGTCVGITGVDNIDSCNWPPL
jgi:hypothetical protein